MTDSRYYKPGIRVLGSKILVYWYYILIIVNKVILARMTFLCHIILNHFNASRVNSSVLRLHFVITTKSLSRAFFAGTRPPLMTHGRASRKSLFVLDGLCPAVVPAPICSGGIAT